ncbi:hypothetical protein [Piscinibacter sp. XHJ-5]|uniref:hypothetical protein n=1 Tax=Piscinibacter sp. XHJ-5 TaxID=3037797 RepID=UPI0024533EEF|nr:hypothetical protein [Piscinibacter sp. XHJ-5]
MNPVLGWTLAALLVAAAWRQYGWQGVLFALTVVVFWLLLQFNRSIRVMKNASHEPVGRVGSAVMLHSKLKPGVTLLQVITLTKSLGRKVSDKPERYEWADDAGSRVLMTFEKGRCTAWELQRPDDAG